MRAALAAVTLMGCGAGQLPAALPPPERALCYAVADQNAQRRVDLECVGNGDVSVPFLQCPARDSILAQLRADLKECK
jgi:hypothetical protein